MAASDPESVLAQLRAFAEKVPLTLRTTRFTADLADEVERHAAAFDPGVLTLAVVGQMRIGKSTLINTLVGQDLALTGVTETTATINWFRHGTQEQARKFRVVWTGQPGGSEERDVSDVGKWAGDSELAARTRYLEFYGTADFLKLVQIVDTPGTRSVIEPHEQAIRGFLLAERRNEQATLYYGGSADCVVYVLPPVARQNDEDLLTEFASTTRLPGSSPYNSVAVLHKWETLDHPEPWKDAERKAADLAKRLHRHVSDVIPVSAPLARAPHRLPIDWWDRLAHFVVKTPRSVLTQMIQASAFYAREEKNCPLSGPERKQLLSDSMLPWPCFTLILKLACCRALSDGRSILRSVVEIAGFPRLLPFLTKRFFERARVIHSSRLLAKSLGPCQVAALRLREAYASAIDRSSAARSAIDELEPFGNRTPLARAFLAETLNELEKQSNFLDKTLRSLESDVAGVRESFEQLDRDLEAIRLMDDRPDFFTEAEAAEILAILGAYGTVPQQRLSRILPADQPIAKVEVRLVYWHRRRDSTCGVRARVLDQVVQRLQELLADLKRDDQGAADKPAAQR
jgi:hypothetical protein